ncbi:hypothetical protein [Gordonia malaquae]|uniref:hypothetical protein n=1 Tax=Gordonia malaquae TaxID=410332 RepID=UPI003015EE7E
MSSPTTDQFIEAARLAVNDRDPDNAVTGGFIDHIESIINGGAGRPFRTLDDVGDLLGTLRDGIAVIDDCRAANVDVEDPLTEAVGPYLAEPLDNLYASLRGMASAGSDARTVVNKLIDDLLGYIERSHYGR